MIYLDHNATSPILPEVVDSMAEFSLRYFGNPSSQHQVGQRIRRELEQAREQIAGNLNVNITEPAGDRLVLTSGGTEANNLAVFGLVKENDVVVVSSIEHPSILEATAQLSQRHRVIQIPATPSGSIDIEQFEQTLAENAESGGVAFLMAANNETGVLQPTNQIGELCKTFNFRLHTDAIQMVGKTSIDFQDHAADTMSFAAHKFGGPAGIGALAIRRGISVQPSSFGGKQQLGMRAGTESVTLAVGMARAMQIASEKVEQAKEHLTMLRDRFEQRILASISDVEINGSIERLPHTSNLSFLGIDRQQMFMALDFAGIACSTGSACESGSSEPSHVLAAMKLDSSRISSAIRFSFGPSTTLQEIDSAVDRISKVANNLRKRDSGSFSTV